MTFRLSNLLFTLTILLSNTLFAQKPPAKFGDIDIEDLKMTVCPLDSNAGAMYLLDYGSTWFDSRLTGKFTTHVRIKIFNKDELDRGNITIYYPKGSRVERIKASTYNLENGKISESEFNKKDAFDENYDEDTNVKKINLSNVKEGSIIEYQYTVNHGDVYDLNSWSFQASIPVRYSEYRVAYPEYFIYKTIMSGYVRLDEVNNDKKVTDNIPFIKTQYIARNVPAFKKEPYISSVDNYISRIEFEIETINIPGYTVRHILPDNYASLAKTFYESWETEWKRDGFLKDEVAILTNGLETNEEKIKAIYYYIQERFTKNSDYSDSNLKKSWDEKTGTTWQINSLFSMALQVAGINSNIVALSTRANGILHPFYPMAKQFNYYITFAKDGEKEYVMDPSNKFVPFGILPEKCLNGWGLLISEDTYKQVTLNTGTQFKIVAGTFDLDEEGTLSGKLNISQDGYLGIAQREKIKADGVDKYKEEVISSNDTWQVNEYDISGIEEKEVPVVQSFDLEISERAQGLGEIIYLTPLISGGIEENPFKLDERKYPVDYGSSVKEQISIAINIPEGFKVDELPQPMAVALPNRGGRFIYNAQVLGNTINFTCQFQISKAIFVPDEYPYVKAFYDQVVAKYKEQVVLKKI